MKLSSLLNIFKCFTRNKYIQRPIPTIHSGDLVMSRATGHVAVVKYSFVNVLGDTLVFVSWLNGWKEPKILFDSDVIKMNY